MCHNCYFGHFEIPSEPGHGVVRLTTPLRQCFITVMLLYTNHLSIIFYNTTQNPFHPIIHSSISIAHHSIFNPKYAHRIPLPGSAGPLGASTTRTQAHWQPYNSLQSARASSAAYLTPATSVTSASLPTHKP